MNPILTIILPIGDARPTLSNSISSVLASESFDFELLISDNTQGLLKLESHISQDPRVRIIEQPERLNMAEHWLNLMKLASGNWISFMGADDGIISNNLIKLLSYMKNTDAKVVSTHRVEVFINSNLKIEWAIVPETKCEQSVNYVNWNIVLGSLFPQFFFNLPMPYNKAVFKKEILSEFLEQGSDLYGLTPDYFLAFLVALKSNSSVFLDLPIFIHGSSEHSNGWQYQNAKATPALSDFLKRIPLNEDYLKGLPKDCISAWLGNSYLSAKFGVKKSKDAKRISRIRQNAIVLFYQIWIRNHCIFCSFHKEKKSIMSVKTRTFISDKVASFIRNYLLALKPGHRIFHHESKSIEGSTDMNLLNISSFLN